MEKSSSLFAGGVLVGVLIATVCFSLFLRSLPGGGDTGGKRKQSEVEKCRFMQMADDTDDRNEEKEKETQ